MQAEDEVQRDKEESRETQALDTRSMTLISVEIPTKRVLCRGLSVVFPVMLLSGVDECWCGEARDNVYLVVEKLPQVLIHADPSLLSSLF